jgi:hypothetical protein
MTSKALHIPCRMNGTIPPLNRAARIRHSSINGTNNMNAYIASSSVPRIQWCVIIERRRYDANVLWDTVESRRWRSGLEEGDGNRTHVVSFPS